MFKLSRYYKPYLGAILLAVIFLFIQVNMDLALPDYLSRIVNVGLQQGGVESPLPETLRPKTFESISRMLDGDSVIKLNSIYRASDEGNRIYSLVEDDKSLAERDPSFRNELLSAFITVWVLETGRTAHTSGPTAAGGTSSDEKILEPMGIQASAWEYGMQGHNGEELQSRYILRTGVLMLLITLISALATITVGFIAAKVSAGVARSIRFDLFSKVESFSNAEFDRFSTASLITRNTNDITQIQTVTFMLIRMVIFAPIMGIGGVIRALGRAPSMGWIIGLAVLILLGLMSIVMSIALPKFKAIQTLVDRVNKVAREQLSGLLVVRAFNRQDFEKERFDRANRELTQVNLFVTRVMVMLMPLIMLIMNVLSLVIIRVGADQIAASTMQVGDMMAFLQYAMQIVTSFLMLTMAFIFIPRASVSAGRIDEVLRTESSIVNPENSRSPSEQACGLVEFRNVSFKYPGADDMALKNISFTARPGETTAIIGSTGSGKSSLVNLIPRFYDACSGEVLIDGINVKERDLHELRSTIGYVPQTSILFSGTIESNLRYGSDKAGGERLREAARTAMAAEFISEREEGYSSPVSQSGANVSGGQKQRLSIARALVERHPVLIFDDSFSALDYRTDADLRRELEREFGETAKIIVAQRVSTIMRAEQILVLDEGRLVGRGTHSELLEQCETYREIVLSQLSVKEA